ncbi:Myeloid leukemia factor [Orchesella cincta]|uniref:Myeloid leukemia factor n=1 Tax=Orchesella cincta TaxID=48709 RepID=A0A1D2NCU2_ORCCI|nr:Myeloid leukemia factor [Orchesella cincta]
MSLFGSLMGDMERDPIFGAHHRAMNRMMNSFFGGPAAGGGFGLSLMGPQMGHQHHHHHHHPHMEEHHDEMMPFGGAMTPFGPFGIFSRMMNMSVPNMSAPNGHAFSSSSFVSISSGPDGRPQVYQASSETRQGPDGLKETRKAVTDTRSGTKKMAVGRHMDEKAHIVEREQNLRTGQLNENHEFYNLEEEHAPQFDREWRHRAHSGGRYAHSASMPAITASAEPTAEYVEDPDECPAIASSTRAYQPHHSESSVTIEELPASDDEAEQTRSRRSYPHATPSSAAAVTSRRSPYGTSKEKRQKRSKLSKKY